MIDVSKLTLERELAGFLALETTYGQLPPFTSSHGIGLLGLPKATQAESFTDLEEVRNAASRPGRVRDLTPAGSVSFSIYARPSGAVGTPPTAAAAVKAATGIETINAGASVVYSPAIQLPSLSLGFRVGATLTRFVVGLVVEEFKTSGGPKGAIKHDLTGKCMAIMQAGRAVTVAGSTSTVIKLEAGGAKLFDKGALVQVDADNNTGQGYTVSDFDEAADTITVTPALASAPAAGSSVQGYLPTHSLAGEVLEGRLCGVSIGGLDMPVTEWEVSVKRTIKMLDDLTQPGGDYAVQGFAPMERQVTVSCKTIFQGPHLAYFRQARNQTQAALLLGGGSVAGRKLNIVLPRCEVNTPEISGKGVFELPLLFEAMPSAAGEDEITYTFL